jgi:hypothetical protein
MTQELNTGLNYLRGFGMPKFVIGFAAFMLLFTVAIYGVTYLVPTFNVEMYVMPLLFGISTFLPLFLIGLVIFLIRWNRRVDRSDFQRLCITLFTVWTALVFITLPLIITPAAGLLACAFFAKSIPQCGSFDYMSRIPEVLRDITGPIGEAFFAALTVTFLHGWILLGWNLINIYRGKSESSGLATAISSNTPADMNQHKKSRPHFGLRDS